MCRAGVVKGTEVGQQQSARIEASQHGEALPPLLDIDVGRRHRRQHVGGPGEANTGDVAGRYGVTNLPRHVVVRVARSVPTDDLESIDVHCLTIVDRPELVFGNTNRGPPQGLHHVAVEALGRRQQLGRRIFQMWGANRMAEDRAVCPLREYTCTAGMVEVDVGREYGPEVLQPKVHFSDPAFDGVESARGTGIEKYESAFHRHQKRCDQLGGTEKLEVERLNFCHLTSGWEV